MKKKSNEHEWHPNLKQSIALSTLAFEILYGGARGGGKTDAGIVWMLKPVSNPLYRGLVIRKNADDLRDWIDRARYMYRDIGVEVVGKPTEIRFGTGAKILTGHLKDDNAYEKYQGHEYQRMLIEELTQIPDQERYLKLISSCRSTIDIKARVFLTTNPGGPGHSWVKKRFIDPVTPGKKYTDPITKRSRIFIPSTVWDNPILVEKDPDYVNFLKGLPEELMKAWLEGSWDHLVGQYFNEFDRSMHVYDPKDVKILETWPKFRSVDWGYSSPMACYWHAVGPDGHLYTYREWYKTGYLDVDASKEINELSSNEKILYTVGDPQSFPMEIPHFKFGRTYPAKRYEIWSDNGIPMIMGDSSRVFGWNKMREYLKIRPYMQGESSWWHISNQCVNLIEEMTSAIYSKKNVEDIADDCRDHALESCRLAIMSRPPVFKDDEKNKITMLEAAERQQARNRRSNQGYSIDSI